MFAEDYGKIPGLDISFVLGGYFYHNAFDAVENLYANSMWYPKESTYTWTQSSQVGMGMIAIDGDDNVIEVRCEYGSAADPFHAETKALCMALQWIKTVGLLVRATGVVIGTDCRSLVQVMVLGSEEDLPSWRAASHVRQAYQTMAEITIPVHCRYFHRSAIIRGAHCIANWARTHRQSQQGAQAKTLMREDVIGMYKCTDWYSRRLGLGSVG